MNFDQDFMGRKPEGRPDSSPHAKGDTPRMTTSKANGKPIHWGQFTAKFISYALIALIAVLNLQPWFPIATKIAAELVNFPFQPVKTTQKLVTGSLVFESGTAVEGVCKGEPESLNQQFTDFYENNKVLVFAAIGLVALFLIVPKGGK